MKKRLLSLLLCAVLTLALLPATALADDIIIPGYDPDLVQPGFGSTAEEDAGTYLVDVHELGIAYEGCTHNLSIDMFGEFTCHVKPVTGFYAHKSNPYSGAGWSYDPLSYTLTLDGFRGSTIRMFGPLTYNTEHKTPTVTLVLKGDSVITGSGDETYGALTADHVNLVIQGSGSLTLGGEQFGLFASSNNGDYKDGSLDGGRVTVKQGATLKSNIDEEGGSGLTCAELVVESGATVALTTPNSSTAGYAENLVVRGTLTAQGRAADSYSTSFISAMYCTVGTGVTIKGGQDAASATTTLNTHAPQTSPIYGAVTVLDYDAGDGKPLPYIEFREGGSTAPAAPTAPTAPAGKTSYVQNQTIAVDGKPITFQTYALKDAAGNLTNYVKLRDVAHVLNGTAVQFEVAWDGSVNIQTGKSYTSNGSEMKTPFSGDRAYADATAPTKVNGQVASLAAITLTDDNGAGYTYYKLRDLGEALGFQVDWSATEGITVNTTDG